MYSTCVGLVKYFGAVIRLVQLQNALNDEYFCTEYISVEYIYKT